ncbi:hypothetical protein Taro_030536 [Colocasia esculenta]|uniref:Zinc finger PHD-type domain-containing protein n=1 Tax=Colocasia esculenta TaxID=4460 RepID=A0A843VLN0_COLES|nr:hypothetical protein [Colocasia esculenta]
MRKQRVRTLKELHEITQQISEPEAFLKGSCRIQGPVDEVDIDIEAKLAVFSTGKGFGKHYLNEDIPMKASGTCNVCAAPCSSCMHFNRTVSFMESKAEDDNSENSCGRKEADNFSFSNSDMPPFFKSKPCDDRMQEASETSKIFSTTSSHDSYSENTESKGTVKIPDVHDTSEGVDMPLKLISFERVEENQPMVVDYIKSQSSQEPTALNEVQRALPNHQGDPHELECHGDNMSYVTGLRDVNVASSHLSTSLGRKKMSSCTSASSSALPSKGFKRAAQAQAADGNIADIQGTRQQTAKFAKECLQTKSTNYDPTNAGFCNENPESSPLNRKPSPKEECLHSNAKIGKSLCTSAIKDGEENSNCQQPSEGLVEPLESSLGWQITTGVDEQKSIKAFNATIHSNNEKSKASNVKVDASPSGSYQCREMEIGGNNVNSQDYAIIQEIPDEHHEKPSLSVENVQGVQPTLQGESPDQDSFEDDVKVCDICGDAGREDLLAICSRCSDGAEHTYCMRIMLDKVPEGHWLCEECKLNEDMLTDKMEKSDSGKLKEEMPIELKEEMPIDKMEKTEFVSGALKAPSSIEKLQKVGSSFNPKLLPKLDISATAAEALLIVKGLQSPQMSVKKSSGSSEITSLSNKKLSDTSVASVLTASPSRKSMLSRESSFKNIDVGKPKLSNFVPPSGSQSSTGSQVFSRSLTPGPNLSRVQGQLHSNRGPLSRSGSFNSLKAKVKQVIKNIPQKPQFSKEHATSDTKEGFGRTLSKSASCKNINSGHLNVTESTTKSQSVSLHLPEESRILQHSKEKAIERKNSFVLNRTLTSSSSASAPSVLIVKTEPKVMQNDGKVNSVPESNCSHRSKGMEDSHDKGARDLRKQESHASKASGNHSPSGACNFADQKQTHVASKEDAHVGSSGDTNTIPQRILTNSSSNDEKFKESTLIGSSRSLTLPSKRILRCQRCNETGHSTQFCSIDKLRISASKPSIERTSREAANKGCKWKDAVDAAISKGRAQRNSPDQSEEISSTDICSEIVSQNHSSSSSSCVKGLSTMEGAADKQSSLRNSAAASSKTTINDMKQHAPQMLGNVCTSRDGDTNALSTHREELKEKPSTQILPEHNSILVDPLRVSALPVHEYIWQGSFEVKRPGRLPELSDGFQAHLSTCASPKVLKVVNKFPDKIQLEEVARLSSWPLQFQENSPTEENIALFFFAKDVSSYEKSYSKLLDSMLRNDLALKGNFEGIELLIFPSSKLPEKCQRWNRLLFLWGVFRERRSSCPHMSSGQSRPGRSNNHSEHSATALPVQPVTKVPTSEKESSHEDMDKDMPRHDKSMKTEADDLKNLSFVKAESAPSCIVNSYCHTTPILGKISENAIDRKCHPDRNTSNPSAATDLLTTKSEQTSSYDAFHQPSVQKNTAQLILETCQRRFDSVD